MGQLGAATQTRAEHQLFPAQQGPSTHGPCAQRLLCLHPTAGEALA